MIPALLPAPTVDASPDAPVAATDDRVFAGIFGNVLQGSSDEHGEHGEHGESDGADPGSQVQVQVAVEIASEIAPEPCADDATAVAVDAVELAGTAPDTAQGAAVATAATETDALPEADPGTPRTDPQPPTASGDAPERGRRAEREAGNGPASLPAAASAVAVEATGAPVRPPSAGPTRPTEPGPVSQPVAAPAAATTSGNGLPHAHPAAVDADDLTVTTDGTVTSRPGSDPRASAGATPGEPDRTIAAPGTAAPESRAPGPVAARADGRGTEALLTEAREADPPEIETPDAGLSVDVGEGTSTEGEMSDATDQRTRPSSAMTGADPDHGSGDTEHRPARATVPATPANPATPAVPADPATRATPASRAEAPAPVEAPVAPTTIQVAAPVAGTSSAPAAAPPPAPAAAPVPVPQQIVQHVTPIVQRGEGVHEITIDLDPVDLGRLRVEIVIDDGVVNIKVHADDAGARRLIADQINDLRNALRDAGLSTGDLDVRDGGSRADERGHDRRTADRPGDRRLAGDDAGPSRPDSGPTRPPVRSSSLDVLL